jgi:UDP-N-acetylmuramoyl-tripeptide--D-alanyl-D-alanine ligase
MIALSLATIAQVLDARIVMPAGQSVAAAEGIEVLAVSTDTRQASEVPALFVALLTERADGHDHLAAAARSGAVAVLVMKVAPDVSLPQLVVSNTWVALRTLAREVLDRAASRVVAITGSYGKTTTKDLIVAALGAQRRTVGARASFNNELGVPLTMLAVEADTEILVAELGARLDGDLALTARLVRPDIAVVTAVGPVHLETFGDIDGVAREKAQLVAALGPDGVAVLNADDHRVAEMPSPGAQVLLVSADGRADAAVRATDVTSDELGRVSATVETPWGCTHLSVPLPGRHHLTNALLALTVAGVEGVDLDAAAAAIGRAPTSASRSVLLEVGGVRVLDDAYNASAPTVLGALRTLQELPCDGRRWAVLGLMAELGPTSLQQHREVGRAAAGVDVLVIVGDGAAGIAEGALEAGLEPSSLYRCADVAEVDRLLAAEIVAGDVVLFKASRVVGLDRSAAALMASLTAAGMKEAAR